MQPGGEVNYMNLYNIVLNMVQTQTDRIKYQSFAFKRVLSSQ